VQALVIHESLTGHTRRAGELIAEELTRAGVSAVACPTTRIDLAALADADLVVVGTWTDGILVVGQRPGRAGRLRKLPAMMGKRAAVYCTYAIDPGRTLDKLSVIVAERGATVLGGFAIHRTRLEQGAADFTDRVLAALDRPAASSGSGSSGKSNKKKKR
jgi:hypothetical protein